MKTCFKCRAEKPISEFYKHRMMSDGHLGKCKDCTKADTEARRLKKTLTDPEWVQVEKLRHRIKTARRIRAGLAKPVSLESKRAYHRRERIKFPEKFAARAKTARAIKSGLITRKPCHCGAVAQAHHEDYSKPLDVVWLCPKHHAERHIQIREGK